ncbi:hypothetical protein TNCV_2799681 [Trichonephila clavipes]|nr:hypothetical protein TNCV_2799681 [Trichonephila clavipes]
MSRFGGLSEERPSVFKTRIKLGTRLSTQCSGDERQSPPCAAQNESDGGELSCSHLDSNDDLRLNEKDSEESEKVQA